jgi:hypothetical protein
MPILPTTQRTAYCTWCAPPLRVWWDSDLDLLLSLQMEDDCTYTHVLCPLDAPNWSNPFDSNFYTMDLEKFGTIFLIKYDNPTLLIKQHYWTASL